MSNRDDLKVWIEKALTAMPVSSEDFFKKLWKEGKIHYDHDSSLIDDIDEISSKLTCSALDKRIYFLVVLPDLQIHRGAMIFCTILIKYAVKCILEQIPNKRILYFGTTLKFKYAIESTYVGNLPVSSAFTYIQASGKYDKYNDNTKSIIPSEYLPEVICVYNPASPQQYINSYKPDVVVIDCGKEYEIEWIDDLLVYCKKKNIPVIGWCKNSFSKAINAFEAVEGSIFYYPKKEKGVDSTDLPSLFLNNALYEVSPLILSGHEVDAIDKNLTGAKGILRGLSNSQNGRLKQDALRLAWKYIRTLESLTIPVNIYNAEARSFWRTYSLTEYKRSLSSFNDQIGKNDVAFSDNIESFLNILDNIIFKFEQAAPPFWSTLSNFCMDRPPEGQLRVIIFPTKSQKQLFSYTLLSRFNISEDELFTDSKAKLKTLKEFLSLNGEETELSLKYRIKPLFVGIPDLFNKGNFYEILPQSPEVLIYPHQAGYLKSIIQEYNLLEKEHLKKSMKTLKRLSDQKDEVNVPAKVDRCSFSKEVQKIQIESKEVKNIETGESTPLINVGNIHSELAALLENNETNETDYLPDIDISDKRDIDDRAIFIANALEFILEDNYRLVTGPDEQLNIVKSGKIESVYVRAITTGNKLLLIQNQPRQNLYDLIISRVHNHPSLEIHMAMLKKWKEEFHLGYLVWKEENANKGLDDFLKLLQQKGSSIVAPLTISNWLNGYTLRPQDELDMYRLGEVLNIKFIKENYRRIYTAASRIVGIHISLSRKLNEWLNKKAFTSDRDDMEIIDEEVGLTFGELKSSIKILQVERINIITQPLLVTSLGRLEKVH